MSPAHMIVCGAFVAIAFGWGFILGAQETLKEAGEDPGWGGSIIAACVWAAIVETPTFGLLLIVGWP